MTTLGSGKKRPLSPHLQVYRLPLTAFISVFHRLCGVALAIGTLLVAAFFFAAALGEDSYNIVMGYATSPLGQLVLFAWSAALYFHMCNGIRHMIWDSVLMLDKSTAMKSNYGVIIGAIILTASTWIYALNF